MFIIIMMSRDVVSYITCMLYVRCKIFIIIKNNMFIYFSDIDITISVYMALCLLITTSSIKL